MASTNFKLFDENKTNMMSDTEYNINTQRLNGVQAGIASSQLQNKTLYQTSLVAYSLAQIMMQNGYDASDSAAFSTFVSNMSGALLQKVMDKATDEEAKTGIITNKWISPAAMKAACLLLSGGTMTGNLDMGGNIISNVGAPISNSDVANKQYVDGKIKTSVDIFSASLQRIGGDPAAQLQPKNSKGLYILESDHDLIKMKIDLSLNAQGSLTSRYTVNYSFFNEDFNFAISGVGIEDESHYYTFIQKERAYYCGFGGTTIGSCFLPSVPTNTTRLIFSIKYTVTYIDIS